MGCVQVLPDNLINQIAAGEIIERPASVVKELVENAIDAGADRIGIEIEAGGKTLIRVSDNGCGMSREDAVLAVERHATSKIRSEADLFAIHTLGFRGEALPSIASVSKFSLITRAQDTDCGVEIVIEGGRVVSIQDTGSAPGTLVSVNQLFFNTPARRKFMKTAGTEMSHIAEIINTIALGNPGIQFKLSHNGHVIYHFSKAGSVADRLYEILGPATTGRLKSFSQEQEDAKISGWVGEPTLTRTNGRYQFIYVNGRSVRDRLIQRAIMDAFTGWLMKGQFPVAVLWLEVPAHTVDVNVHPTKSQVKFADSQKIYSLIKGLVAKTIGHGQDASVEAHPFKSGIGMMPGRFPAPLQADRLFEIREEPGGVEKQIAAAVAEPRAAAFPPPIQQSIPGAGAEISPDGSFIPFDDLVVIGQLHETYILCETGASLVLIDQHAAHERIVYERLSRSPHPETQYLLIPQSLDCSPREADILLRLAPKLQTVGLEIEPFGRTTFAVLAVPALIDASEAERIVRELIDRLLDTGNDAAEPTILDACIKVMACHSAIRANQKLSRDEMQSLIRQLGKCEFPARCPHGRPTWIAMGQREIEKKFGRLGSISG
ncbi:DNA mismatch repair endonuclease MutL [Desulfatirhabdium butyrativorans]|uniref:DNA mismatch repair endonuclease MutL n=1 Tax=Desulfatirhabdium butyrativorans TaxID=340467 RepID=UPI000403A893|nr:DNA mismatch repair endonuclease MutL [Desulfatirhabdium butyrativorans]